MSSPRQPGGRAAAPAPLDLVQDFANTVIPEWERDDLATPAALVAWLRDRGLLGGAVRADEAALRRAHALRAVLRALAVANARHEAPTGDRRAQLDDALRALPVALACGEGGIRVAPGVGGIDGALASIAVIAATASLDGTFPRLKACRDETCRWVFYDGSRNRSSSWCSMRVCGGRVKARAARRRRSEEA